MEPPNKVPSSEPLNLDNIRAIKVLGKGAMGTVFLAHDRVSDPHACLPFALKVVDKSLLHLRHDAERRAHWEMTVLSLVSSHPFLPTLLGQFEAHDLMGWAVPFCSGGDLNSLRYTQNDRVFSPAAIKFYLAEIVCALSHLHSMGIAYRDLKPENVLVQGSGHVTLTDFDLSRKLSKPDHHHHHHHYTHTHPHYFPPKPAVKRKNLTRIFLYGSSGRDSGLKKTKSARVSPVSRRRTSFAAGQRSNSFVGTEEYVSPEVVRGEGHAFDVDWWALGVLAYEMLYGKTPFRGGNRKETFRNVLTKKPEFVGKRTALMDLIERLLEKDPVKRLGHFRGVDEIKEHEFFNGLRWDLLTDVVRTPFVPSSDFITDQKQTELSFDIREYFQKGRVNLSTRNSSMSSSMSEDEEEDDRSISLTEF